LDPDGANPVGSPWLPLGERWSDRLFWLPTKLAIIMLEPPLHDLPFSGSLRSVVKCDAPGSPNPHVLSAILLLYDLLCMTSPRILIDPSPLTSKGVYIGCKRSRSTSLHYLQSSTTPPTITFSTSLSRKSCLETRLFLSVQRQRELQPADNFRGSLDQNITFIDSELLPGNDSTDHGQDQIERPYVEMDRIRCVRTPCPPGFLVV